MDRAVMTKTTRLAMILALLLTTGCAAYRTQSLAEEGFEALSAGRLELAEQKYKDCLALDPDHPYCLLNLGVVYQRTGRFFQAEAMYEKVIRMNSPVRAVSSDQDGAVGRTLTDIARDNLKALP
jgi:tetratricopeptide (TPR) repeat protein